MISHILIILLFLSAAFGAPSTRYEEPEPDAYLRKDFLHFVKERLNSIISLSHGAPPSYLLISVKLTECKENDQTQRISFGQIQTTWEEESCGTEQMQNWCNQFPGKMITLMTGDERTGTSVMAQFTCELPKVVTAMRTETDRTQMMIAFAVLVFILVVIYNFRRMCKEQSECKLKNAMKTIVENSMDTVNLDSSCKDKSPKEPARFDDDSDPSLGTLFTL